MCRDIDSFIKLAELEADIERDTLQLFDLGSKGGLSIISVNYRFYFQVKQDLEK